MTTPQAVIKRLLHPAPSGCPRWPPDAFAVAATIVESAGLYAAARYAGGVGGLLGKRYLERVDGGLRYIWIMAKFSDSPKFVVRELEKAARSPGMVAGALKVARKLPQFRVNGEDIELVQPSVKGSAKGSPARKRTRSR